ncbi:MAG: hypothetical protein U1E86_28555 [Burkholderiaceae bacterium]
MADIRELREYLGRNGIVVCKFFLNVSKDEQKKRFLELPRRREELEVLGERRGRAAALGRAPMEGVQLQSGAPRRRTRRGTSCPRTTSGSRVVVAAAVMIDTLGKLDAALRRSSRGKLRRGRHAARVEVAEWQR